MLSRKRRSKTFGDTLNVDNKSYDSPETVSVGFRDYYENILKAPPTFASADDELFYNDVEAQTHEYPYEDSPAYPILEKTITVTEDISVIKDLKRSTHAKGFL